MEEVNQTNHDSNYDVNYGASTKRIRKALRCLRLRPLKNFFIWFSGLIMSFVLFALVIVLALTSIPLGTFLGKEMVSENVSEKSILGLIENVNQLKIADFPVVTDLVDQMVDQMGLDKYVEIDTEKLKDVQFSYSDGEKDFATELQSCITVTATLNSVGGKDLLGDPGKLDIFSKWIKVPSADYPELDNDGKLLGDVNPKLYYYDVSGANGETPNNPARAFDNDGKLVAPTSAQLYLPNLADVVILDAFEIITERMSYAELNNILSVFGAGDAFGDSFIGNLLEGKTIGDLSSISADDFKLVDILGKYEDNKQLFDILSSAVSAGKGTTVKPEDLTVGDLSHLSTDGIKLMDILDKYEDNKDLYDIMCSAVNSKKNPPVTAETITVGDLSLIDKNGINLKDVLGAYESNKNIYDIVCSAVNANKATPVTPETITIGDLANLSIDGIRLTDVLKYSEKTDLLYRVLLESANIAFTDANIAEKATLLTVKDISVNVNNVKLSTVLPNLNSDTVSLICGAINNKRIKTNSGEPNVTKDNITIGQITEFDADYASLISVLPINTETTMLYKVLLDSANKDWTETNLSELAKELTIADVKVDMNNVKLSTVIQSSSNNILSLLIADETVTVGNIGTKIDELLIEEVFPAVCFTTTNTGSAVYYKVDNDEYMLATHVNNPTDTTRYYISEDAHIWLFLYYNPDFDGDNKLTASDFDTHGNAIHYKDTHHKLSELQYDVDHISDRLMGATIRQLVDTKLLDDGEGFSEELYIMTLSESIKKLDEAVQNSK